MGLQPVPQKKKKLKNHLDLTANPYQFAFHSNAQEGHL